VTPSNASTLLVLANLSAPGTADATVGFELSGPSSLAVDTGDTVQTFAAIRSTRALVNVRPRVTSTTVDGWSPGSPQISHLLGGTPIIAWTFEDDNSADLVQAAYNVSVRSVSPSALLWYRNDTSALSSAAYAGPALQPGLNYRSEVRLYDGRVWSAATATDFRRNSLPSAPVLLDPADLAQGVPTNAVLTWGASSDSDGDPFRYFWWVSQSPGFSSAMSGITVSETVGVVLAAGTEYFWKAGASDGYEFASGNATVWRFTTGSPTPPILGEIRGRVMNGTTGRPLAGALVELLNGTRVLAVNQTGADGLFVFGDLSLGPYTVEVQALAFTPRTLQAEPTSATPRIDLRDIVLSPVGDPGTGPGSNLGVAQSWLPWVIAVLALVFSILAFLVLRRKRKEEEAPTSEGESSAGDEGELSPTPLSESSESSPEVQASSSATTNPPGIFECPACGRLVSQATVRCVCGAEFDS
jgi:hypothetical protein